jgi:hypothetical protein
MSVSQLSKPSTAVFIASSDNTADVLCRVFPSFMKYWANCAYPVYVGLNERSLPWDGPRVVRASRSEWRVELKTQLGRLSEDRVILMLDDFLIQAPVDQEKVANLLKLCFEHDWPYLRLIPLERAFLPRLMHEAFSASGRLAEPIPVEMPYFSSLQTSIWKKSHLESLLEVPGSIWQFEHLVDRTARHYAVTGGACIRYRHLVEKGRWLPDAADKLIAAGLPTDLGSRPVWPGHMRLRQRWLRAKFGLLGYAGMRLRLKLQAMRRQRAAAARARG